MDDILNQHAYAYASRHQLKIAERLGFGNHGNIFVTKSNPKVRGKTAIKAFRFPRTGLLGRPFLTFPA